MKGKEEKIGTGKDIKEESILDISKRVNARIKEGIEADKRFGSFAR